MSKKVPVSLNSKPYQNIDSVFLDDFSEELIDGYIDDGGDTLSRPGVQNSFALGTGAPVTGAYWWENKNATVFESEGLVFLVTEAEVVTQLNSAATVLTGTGERTIFCDNGDYLVAANGGVMIYTDGTANSAVVIVDGDAPAEVTHVAFIDQYLLANEVGTGRFHFCSFISAPSAWRAVDVYTAESNPDNIISLYVNNRIIYIIGTQSLEFWFNDGTGPFSRMEGTLTSRGGMSPYSNCFVNENMFLFDDERVLVYLNGTSPTPVSIPYEKTIQELSEVDDCIMDYVNYIGKRFLIITFPTADRTFVYDVLGQYWCEWTYFDVGTDSRKRFLGNCYVYARSWNQHLFGSFQVDQIMDMRESYTADNTSVIRFRKTTGFISHGAEDLGKRSYKLTLRLKRGQGTGNGGNTMPYARFRWRDVVEGDLVWSTWRYIPLGTQGHRGFLYTMTELGTYYARQYQIECSENVKFGMGVATETIDINEF